MHQWLRGRWVENTPWRRVSAEWMLSQIKSREMYSLTDGGFSGSLEHFKPDWALNDVPISLKTIKYLKVWLLVFVLDISWKYPAKVCLFSNKVLLCSPWLAGTCYVDLAGLNSVPASAPVLACIKGVHHLAELLWFYRAFYHVLLVWHFCFEVE